MSDSGETSFREAAAIISLQQHREQLNAAPDGEGDGLSQDDITYIKIASVLPEFKTSGLAVPSPL